MAEYELVVPLTAPTHLFVGRKPIALLFGDERVAVKNWRNVYATVIGRCNQDADDHELLMYMRNKAAGKVRKFLSDSPDGMTCPLMVDDDLYAEIQYGSATLMHILLNQILGYTNFDYSGIRVALKQ